MKSQVSVIIPVRESDTVWLHKKLTMLYDGKFTDFETIVVDDNSPVSMKETCSKFNVNYIRLNDSVPYNSSVAKNVGVKQAKADWICLSDVDVYFSSENLKKLLLFTDSSRTDVIIGRLFTLHGNEYLPHPYYENRLCCLAIIKKSLFWKIGGCEERLKGHYGYDDEFLLYKLKKCTEVMLVPDAVAYMDRPDRGTFEGDRIRQELEVNLKKKHQFMREFDEKLEKGEIECF